MKTDFSLHELSRLSGHEMTGLNEIIETAQRIRESGVDIILVSMGARGILLVSEKDQCLASPPEVDVVNTIGAGDSAVAGFVYGMATGKSLQESLICAVAAGTATTLRPGPALCTKDDFHKLVPQVKLKKGDFLRSS